MYINNVCILYTSKTTIVLLNLIYFLKCIKMYNNSDIVNVYLLFIKLK